MASSSELASLFPSATHPALPVAAQILSTLRQLTAPGKGNDLRPEERAALVGVAALLGCERVQSKDLVESSAQKASAVSPARFKSALALSRRILHSVPDQPSPSGRRSARAPTTTSAAESSAGPSTTPSPFSTPKKKFKFTSGTDLSGLIGRGGGSPHQHQHSPAKPSPLKQSATEREQDRVEEKEEEGEEERTPTKSWRGDKRRREAEGRDAFLALRPGGANAPVVKEVTDDGDIEMEFPRIPSPEKLVPRVKRPRKDWTFAESVWGEVSGDAESAEKICSLIIV